MSDLLPCPFGCGGKVEGYMFTGMGEPHVPHVQHEPKDGCALYRLTFMPTRPIPFRCTAAEWNTRAGTRTPAPNAPLSGVRDALKGMVETEIELQGDTDSTRFWAAQLATLEAHIGAPQGVPELEAARRVYREYGMKDTTIDAGNLYWALGVALGAPRFTPEARAAIRHAIETLEEDATNAEAFDPGPRGMKQSIEMDRATAAALRALLQEGTGG